MPSRRLAAASAALALAAPVAADAAPVKPPKARPTATGYGGAAATVDPYATKAAIDVLKHGGNAIDATVAAAGALGVVEPFSSGIGGGGYMVIRTRTGKVTTIDGRETAPAAFTPSSFVDPGTGRPIAFDEAVTSGLGVGVPGTVRTWQTALRSYGTRSLRSLLRPGIRLASKGFEVDKTLAAQTASNAERFADFPATARIYLPGGKPIEAGTTLRNRDMARTYRLIARKGPGAFYRGAVASDIVRTVKAPPARTGAARVIRPGVMATRDLARYRTIRHTPTAVDFRGLTVQGMGPSSSGGTTVGEALNIIEGFGGASPDTTTELYRYLEASKLAYADRNRYLGDSAFVNNPLSCLLSQSYGDTRRALITETAATTPVAAGGECGAAATPATENEGPNTTHLTVADAEGNVVSYTFTIEQTGGSGIVVPGRGFLLNNELTDFNFTPGTANSPAGGKRPRSSMSPTILSRRGKPFLALGSPGGASIITTVLQTIVNRVDRKLPLPQAIAAPRLSQRNGAATEAEPAFTQTPEYATLQAKGEVFKTDFAEPAELGTVAAVEFLDDGRMQAASEPVRRGGGSAMVVSTKKPKPRR